MPDELLQRLQRFQTEAFPLQRSHFRHLVDDGQHPMTLFIGCSDSRLVPYLLTGAGPGELFLVRNVGAFVPPHDQSQGFHGTAAAIEFAVLNLAVRRIVVCGHSHCGAIRALYGDVSPAAKHLSQWLELGREAALPVSEPGPDVLRRTEQFEEMRARVAGSAPGWQDDLPLAVQVGAGQRFGLGAHLCGRSPGDDLPAVLAGTRAHVEQAIRLLHDLGVVLDHQQ